MTVLQNDFLQLKQSKGYDCVVMHPPFITLRDNFEYVDHFNHAFNMLVEGGTLIGAAPIELMFATTGKVKALREMILLHRGVISKPFLRTIKVKENYVPFVLIKVVR